MGGARIGSGGLPVHANAPPQFRRTAAWESLQPLRPLPIFLLVSTTDSLDRLQGFSLPVRNARGRFARLGPTLDRILSAHDYPPAIEAVLAEALVLAVLLGSTLKADDGQLTMQAQTKGGAVDLLVCDWRGGELRGYVNYDADRLAEAGPEPTLFALFGQGYLAVTFDVGSTGQRYQGVVPLEGETLSDAARSYFAQSEQLPSLFRVAIRRTNAGMIAGGLMLQHLPEGEEGRERLHTRLDHPEWEHVLALARTVTDGELTDIELAADALLWRLFHEEEVRLFGDGVVRRGCRCDPDYLASVLARFPADEQAQMADENGIIQVDCAFCARVFPLDAERLAQAA